jgi:HlyD family secretion protein
MKKKWILIGGVALFVIIGSIGLVSMKGRGPKAPEVQTGKVTRQKIVQKVSGTGKIQPKTQVKISADVSARINKIAVVEGQHVEKGQLLVELDRERYLAMVESGEANVHSATANATLVKQNMMQTEREFNRTKEMMNQKLTSQSVYDAAEAAYQVEVARYQSASDQAEQAKAALKQARDDLSKTTIYSPMAGTITDLNKEQGEIAIGSQFQPDVILIVADLSVMEAQVNVDENDIVQLGIGQDAEIQVDALPDTKLKGKVTDIANSANATAAGTQEQKTEFEIKIAVTDPPQTLRPGMTATADIFTKTNESALSVPIQSVAVRTVDQLAKKGEDVKKAGETYKADKDGFVEIVFVVDGGKAMAHPVKTGIQSDELIEITDGLKEGDEIVTGSYRAISKDLTNGGPVLVNNNPKPGKGMQHGPGGGDDDNMADKK